MQANFDDILSLEDVKGVILLSKAGNLMFKKFTATAFEVDLLSMDWAPFLKALQGAREADFIFEKYRLYLRDSTSGFLIVIIGHFAPIAMVRLNCDILLPSLKKPEATKGLGRFFKRKK
jgi:hypothetical protein